MWNVEIFLTRSQRGVSGASDTLTLYSLGNRQGDAPKAHCKPIVVLFFDLSLFYYYFI